MFRSPGARYALRTSLVGVASFCASLQALLPLDGDDLLRSVLAGVIGGLTYAGIGAVSAAVEPNIGNKT